jgi:ABC-2 type transport system permease protein
MVGASGIDTSAWGTDVLAVIGEAWINLYLSLVVWGVLGLVIAVLTRSAVGAVAIGIGYVLVLESLIKMTGDAPSDLLLGTTLNAIASGGTAAVSFGSAIALGGVYVIVGLVLAGVVFTRRDVTD